jgi:hypothetical protein
MLEVDTVRGKDFYERNDSIRFRFEVRNVGEGIAEETFVRINVPYKVSPIDYTYQISLGKLIPGEIAKGEAWICAKSMYEFDYIPLGIYAYEKEYWSNDKKSVEIPLINFYRDGFDTELELRRTISRPYRQLYLNNRGGPAMFEGPVENDIRMEWHSPDPFYEGYEFELQVDYLHLSLDIFSPDEFISFDDVQLYINGNVAKADIDFSRDEAKVIISKDGKLFRYVNEIKLKEGLNQIEIKIKGKNRTYSSKKIIVHCKLLKPDLFLYSIGIPHKDLQYSSKDASDFASLFEGNTLFEQIIIHRYIDSLSTSTVSIKDALSAIEGELVSHTTRQKERNELNKQTMVIVFISSHGFVKERKHIDDFRIACSDFDFYKQSRSIDFDADILGNLEMQDSSIVSFIVIDACKSGAIEGHQYANDSEQLNESRHTAVVNQLVDKNSRVISMVSCRSGELSYEDPAWGNGAFTLAIKEAMHNEISEGENEILYVDKDEDDLISIKELYDYLCIRVPILVKEKRPKVKTSQTPYLSIKDEESTVLLLDLRKVEE